MPANKEMISVEETNERIEKILEKRFKNKDAKSAELRQQVAEREQRLAEMQAELADMKERAAQSPQQQLEKLEREHAEHVAELTAKIERVHNERVAIDRATAEMEKQSALLSALSKHAKLSDVGAAETAVKLFADRIELDEQGAVKFRDDNGQLVDVDAGIKKSLPDFLRPVTSRTGSGASGGVVPTRRKSTELTQAEHELKTIKQRCLQAGSPTSMVLRVRRQQQKIEFLKERKR